MCSEIFKNVLSKIKRKERDTENQIALKLHPPVTGSLEQIESGRKFNLGQGAKKELGGSKFIRGHRCFLGVFRKFLPLPQKELCRGN